MSDNQYFASKPASEAAAILLGKSESWVNILNSNGYIEKLQMSWAAYHGAYYSDAASGHKITFGGTEGELVNLPVNHVRNLAQHILIMTTANRPIMEARAVNTDYKSFSQTILANGLLDYYMREKRLERYLKRAVEYSVVLGAGYVKMAWNATSGEMYEFNEETQSPIYEGDVEFTNLSPFDVVLDNTKENNEHDWVLCRTWKNRFDLMAKYPEFYDAIKGLPSKSDDNRHRFDGFGQNNSTDDVAVWEFFHRRSESMPEGRYLLFVSENATLYDGPLPYRSIPIFRISPADILGTPYGYTSIFDLLPMQEAINSLYSTVLTNQNAFGVQNILVPRGADIAVNQLSGGLNIIEANMQAGRPEALQLTQTPAEVFKMIDIMRQEMETLSGVNSVARGNPEASLKSGAALALVQSMAIQFMSGLQASYVAMIEDVGTALINMLKDFAAVPRVAAIVGRNNRSLMKEFKGDDLSAINRVIVDVGNPLSRTMAGRVEIAQQMLQMGIIKDPSQYFAVINTGRVEPLYEGQQMESMLIKQENEKLMQGEHVPALAVDEHSKHIAEHKSVLADPDLRKNPALAAAVLEHIQAHIDLLRNTDPALLQMTGQQPLAPIPGEQPAMGAPQEGQVQVGPDAQGQQVQGPGIEQGVNLPNMPTPPAPFENLPTNPADLAT